MALIPCKGCGREVSPQAAACPNCGQPIAKSVPTNKNSGCGTLILGGICILFFATVVSQCNKSKSGNDGASKTSQPIAESPSQPVSPDCVKLVEAADRQGSIRPGTVDRSGATLLVDESFSRAPINWQQTIAECYSHYLAKGQDRWIKKIAFVNQRTGVTYGTIEYTRYRVGP
jgi:hypothetical protein